MNSADSPSGEELAALVNAVLVEVGEHFRPSVWLVHRLPSGAGYEVFRAFTDTQRFFLQHVQVGHASTSNDRNVREIVRDSDDAVTLASCVALQLTSSPALMVQPAVVERIRQHHPAMGRLLRELLGMLLTELSDVAVTQGALWKADALFAPGEWDVCGAPWRDPEFAEELPV